MNCPELDDMPEGRDEEAAVWCMRLAEAPLSLAEQKQFDAWIADPDNAAAFDDAVLVWRTAEAAASHPEIIRARGTAIDAFREGQSRRWQRRERIRFYWPIGLAAALVLAVMTGFWQFYDPAQIYQTGIGERRIAMLDDGSRLSLDAATRVEVRLRSDRRALRLISGRAKFDVARDPLRPFSVTAGDKIVVATGTSFSVELLRSQVRVLLYEGHVAVLEQPGKAGEQRRPVRFRATAIPADQKLTAGHELVAPLNATAASVVAADLPRSLSWESGQLNFDDEPLQSAVERMNRYSHVQLVVADARAANIRVNGVFTAGDTDAFVEGVTALYPVRAEPRPGGLTLKSN